ncbi:DUF6966 domain-containing protein [Enterobacter bugandensis]|uniref:DUF6966 domain-containing protein n=1 Tax=Enterobacter bugandensis TaxID=881260 RepID=UPI00064367C3|nr:hypothetical protein [Enterobacter bugandensis]EMC1015621.1 hypothetical protein [Enterobacter bugandensis]KLR24950.1 hypothetical protein ABR26_06680 [Enterobacter bugandensis]MCK6953986.1 hypothetical protein [Enterobacter bugandensis]MCK7210167.1 hypothetical protein [Enterobacter bugandensis]MCM7238149.1 hypothetical protein [Enterobacter bugandensis]
MKSDLHALLNKIIELLVSCDESVWSKRLTYYREHLDSDYDQTVLAIRSIFGGAGSFNDLILQNNGKMLRTENNTLNELSDELYSLIKAEISERNI